MTSILIVGNYTCGNRGDAAIARGLIAGIQQCLPGVQIEMTSQYPVSSGWVLGRPVVPHITRDWPSAPDGPVRKSTLLLLAHLSRRPDSRLAGLLPPAVKRSIDALRSFDAIVQIGGSYFIDLYSTNHCEAPLAVLQAGRPLLLIGHSMGPFGGRLNRFLVGRVMRGARCVALREPVSQGLIAEAGLPMNNVSLGVDTAWLVPPEAPGEAIMARLRPFNTTRPLVAVTVRNLAPFDRRLGISQAQYEQAYARLVDSLVSLGYDVLALSTCTGIGQYQRDDRIPAMRIRTQTKHPTRMHIVTDEINDVELGQMLACCKLLIGTRLHSAIIAMNFGTPALAINYEHKSQGTLEQMGLGDLAFPVEALLDGSLAEAAQRHLEDLASLTARVEAKAAEARVTAARMVREALASADLPVANATSSPTTTPAAQP